jgi:hypothetical protein
MSSDLNYEYAKAYQKYLLKQAEQSRLAHLAPSTRKKRGRPFRALIPDAWRLLSAWPTKVIRQYNNRGQPPVQSQCCDIICEACS